MSQLLKLGFIENQAVASVKHGRYQDQEDEEQYFTMRSNFDSQMNVASIHESENNQTISDQDSGAEQQQLSLLEKENDLFSFRKTFASTYNN